MRGNKPLCRQSDLVPRRTFDQRRPIKHRDGLPAFHLFGGPVSDPGISREIGQGWPFINQSCDVSVFAHTVRYDKYPT